MATRDGSGGGGTTGFLFGNIDKKGRLEEDYLDDEVKDNLDHVGTKMTEKDQELRKISEALPTRHEGNNEDDNDYDDDDDDSSSADDPNDKATHPDPSRIDYYDETDEIDDDEIDDAERTKLAKIAIENAARSITAGSSKKKSDDDDDDYDEDDDDYDDDDPTTKNKTNNSLPGSQVPANSSNQTSAPSSLSHMQTVPPTSQPSSNEQLHKSKKVSVHPHPDTLVQSRAIEAQKRLMGEARERAKAMKPGEIPIQQTPQVSSMTEEEPLSFLSAFFKPPRPIRYIPNRQRYGIPTVRSTGPQKVEPDEQELLDQEVKLPSVNAVDAILAIDAKNAALRDPERVGPAAHQMGTERQMSEEELEEYEEAAAPLSENDTENDGKPQDTEFVSKPEEKLNVDKTESRYDTDNEQFQPFALVQQVGWENDIKWDEQNDSGDESDSQWYQPGMEDKLDDLDKNLSEEVHGEESKESDDDDDDDDEFEDPVIMNENQTANDTKNATETPKEDNDDDDDDDMEWEDGEAATTKEPPQQKSVGGLTGLRSTPMKIEKPKNEKPSETTDKANTDSLSNNEGDGESSKDGEIKDISDKDSLKKLLIFKSDLVKRNLAPNRDLESGRWIEEIKWSSDSENESIASPMEVSPLQVVPRQNPSFRLILDTNDSTMSIEQLTIDSNDPTISRPTEIKPATFLTTSKCNELLTSSGTYVHQLLESDPFNISNDIYYASGTSNFLKVDRQSILRGLQNSPPAIKCQTTKNTLTEPDLMWFRRPKLSEADLPLRMEIVPSRRKRHKGGSAQIAGQMPKKRSELLCSEKDAFRISVFEYALERQPCVLPVPGMASRIITYQRKKSATEAAQASKAAAGTADADTVFMSPDEPPPIHAGDIEADGKPLSVIESHVYAAPCVRTTPSTTDFLLVRNGKHLYVREIDSVISVGVTEPKVDVMAPNTERYKKYSKDRVLLWVMRDFSRQRKEISKLHKDRKGREDRDVFRVRDPPYIEKDEIFREFPRRRTFPETSLIKLLKEHSRNDNGKYVMTPEPPRGWAAREMELLRTLNPQETCAFEAMESGWEQLLERGVQIFTHPSGQGNILSAANPEKSGLENGTEVGKYIKTLLLKTPWYRSQNIIAAHRQQQKELQQVLSLARIVNDLKEGGAVMESRLMSLTPAEMNSVLTSHYRVNAKKIPPSVEERRTLVREMTQRKTKAPVQDMSDYGALIRNVLKKHRDAGLAKGAAIAATGTAMANGSHLSLPLEIQLRALEMGDTSELPIEEDDFGGIERDIDNRGPNASPGPNDSEAPSEGNSSRGTAFEGTREGSSSMITTGANSSYIRRSGESTSKANDLKKGKKRTKLKVKKKVIGPDGKVNFEVRYVTDPEEIAKLLKNNKPKKAAKKPPEVTGKDQDLNSSRGDLKIAIDLRMLSQGVKANVKKKKKPITTETKKNQKKSDGKTSEAGSSKAKLGVEKGRIGKIKISAKELTKDKEQAALKRKRSQYGDEIDYNTKKVTKTSRRKRNGTVELNGILERIEKNIRLTEGYVVPGLQVLRIARLRDGESPPPGIPSNNLAMPRGTGLDFTAPVDTKLVPQYKAIVKKPMYLNLVRQKCKRMQYHSSKEFIADMELLVQNARAFNISSDDQWVVQHAELLLEVAVELVSQKADEVLAAEEMVKLEKSEAKASGAGSSGAGSSKQKKKRSGSGKGTDSKKKKKKGSTEVVEIPDVLDTNEVPIIDLNNDGSEPLASPLPIPSSNPTSSPLLDAGITDDIYGMDKAGLSGDEIAPGDLDKLVLDLDD